MIILKEALFELNGKQINKYRLSNNSGMSAGILDLGCVIWKLNFPNRNGKLIDVVLGYGDPQKYFDLFDSKKISKVGIKREFRSAKKILSIGKIGLF